jgi:hypothetical protein
VQRADIVVVAFFVVLTLAMVAAVFLIPHS